MKRLCLLLVMTLVAFITLVTRTGVASADDCTATLTCPPDSAWAVKGVSASTSTGMRATFQPKVTAQAFFDLSQSARIQPDP